MSFFNKAFCTSLSKSNNFIFSCILSFDTLVFFSKSSIDIFEVSKIFLNALPSSKGLRLLFWRFSTNDSSIHSTSLNSPTSAGTVNIPIFLAAR